MTEQEERVKEALDEFVGEVTYIADEQDQALSELDAQLGRLELLCETLRTVLGSAEIVDELESYVSAAQLAVDGLGGLGEFLEGRRRSAIANANSADRGDE